MNCFERAMQSHRITGAKKNEYKRLTWRPNRLRTSVAIKNTLTQTHSNTKWKRNKLRSEKCIDETKQQSFVLNFDKPNAENSICIQSNAKIFGTLFVPQSSIAGPSTFAAHTYFLQQSSMHTIGLMFLWRHAYLAWKKAFRQD